MVLNVHERLLPVPVEEAARLLQSLATEDDLLWPHERWPPLRADAPLAVGVPCHHGPVHYMVESLDPGRTVVFRFTRPKGFEGTHGFTLTMDGEAACRLRHTLVMKTRGSARLAWPLFYRPLHDALIEDALDNAERALGTGPPDTAHHPTNVRLLRRLTRLDA
ncbi:MAG: SRPBCC family protein [Euryarchaeota archaeon]|nr:SRPBCC family protein [Euryarchaeota archaeon]